MRRIGPPTAAAVALLVILGLAAGIALAAKPPACPAKVDQLAGCITKVQAAKLRMVVDCNGIKHRVTVAKKAKVTLDDKAAKLGDLKPGSKVTVYGKCARKGTRFVADKVCACSTPRPKAKGK